MPVAVPPVDGLPLFGNLPRFLHDPLGTLRRAAAVGDVSRLRLGFADAVTLHHPEHAHHVLRQHQRTYPKGGAYWASIRGLLGKGLPATEGELWLRQRRMMQPQFHRQRLQALATLVVNAIDQALSWHDVDDDWSVIDVGARMPLLTMNVVSAAMLGTRTSPAQAQAIAIEFDYAVEHIFRGMVAHVLPSWLPVPGRRRFSTAVDRLHATLQRVIDQRRTANDGPSDDLLGLLLAATDEETGEGMSAAQLLDEVTSLFVAGYETTASALQWSIYYLSENPEQLGRLCEVVDDALGGELPGFDDLPALSYARWVVQEAIRIMPPAWWVPRVASEDDEIGGHAIPKGTLVAPITYTIHRHPDHWGRPERFDPERFDPGRVKDRHPLAWMPFGAGPHRCIGQELSLMEATMALAVLVQRYELGSVGHRTQPRFTTVIRPANGVRLRVRRRRDSSFERAVPRFVGPSDSSSAMEL